MLRPIRRLFSTLGASFATPSDRHRLRAVLGVTPLEDRTVPAAIPLTGPNGGAWVKIDTITVATKTNSTAALGVPSNVVLDSGVTYLAVASGTARIATDGTGFTDAEFIRYNKSTGPQDGSSPGFTWNNHGVRLDGVDGGNTAGNFWGGYEADHQYVREVTGQGTALRGWYSDIPGYYGDNSGTLQVDLYAEVPEGVGLVSDFTSVIYDGIRSGNYTYPPPGSDEAEQFFAGLAQAPAAPTSTVQSMDKIADQLIAEFGSKDAANLELKSRGLVVGNKAIFTDVDQLKSAAIKDKLRYGEIAVVDLAMGKQLGAYLQ